MSTKKLLVLTGIFLGLLLFVVLFERHQPTSEEAARARRKLLDFKADAVAGLTIERMDLPKVELAKGKDGRWTLSGANGGPADGPAAEGIVNDLSRLDVVGELRTTFDPKEFGLESPKAKATLLFKDGAKRTVSFGAAVPGTDATAAADGERFGAVKYAPLASLAKPYDEYRAKGLFEVPAAEITKLTVAKGPNKIVVVREAAAGGAPSPWRIEAPVKDLASGTFVDQLLADLAGARASEFPAIPPADLSRVGLQPPNVLVTVQKGSDVVATLSFGAAKAEAAGKMYARRDGRVLVIDDRVRENLDKEFTAYREARLAPVDSWAARKVSFESDKLRAGAEKVEGEWRSAGNGIPGGLAEDLIEKATRAEVRQFVPAKEAAAQGLGSERAEKGTRAARTKPVDPAATLEIGLGDSTPRVVRFFSTPALSARKLVAAEATGRSDVLLVDSAVLEEARVLAGKIRAAAETAAKPKPTPRAASAPRAAPVGAPSSASPVPPASGPASKG